MLDRTNAMPDYPLSQSLAGTEDAELIVPRDFLGKMDEFLCTPIGTLKAGDAPWLTLIESARSIWGERWALCRLAVDAAAIVKGGAIAIECSLVDQGIPLFTRAARARRAAGDRQWWLNELCAAQGADALIQQFTVLALYRSMAIDDIVALAGTIGTMLDILPERHWLGLADAAHVPWHRPRRPQRQQITTTALPASMSPRLASLLIFRVSTATGQLIRHRYLLDYRGNDRAILEAIIEVVTKHAFDKPQARS
jgi:hypothetical protein